MAISLGNTIAFPVFLMLCGHRHFSAALCGRRFGHLPWLSANALSPFPAHCLHRLQSLASGVGPYPSGPK